MEGVATKPASKEKPQAQIKDGVATFDLETVGMIRELHQYRHHELPKRGLKRVQILHPDGQHSIAVGIDHPVTVEIMGNAGYFTAGMNKQADIVVHGNVGWSFAENIMSGTARVKGFASECAAASGHGGLVVIEGDASSRCGISMKGVDIVVGGDVGHMSAFMSQAGRLVVCGDAAVGLGDSLYEAVIYVRGKLSGLGADAREEEMTDADRKSVGEMLKKAVIKFDTKEFKRI